MFWNYEIITYFCTKVNYNHYDNAHTNRKTGRTDIP